MWHHGPLFKATFDFPDTHSTVCTSYLSRHYLLITLKYHILKYQALGSLGPALGSPLTWSMHTQPCTFGHHLCLTARTSLYWGQTCLLSSRSIFNCPLSISRWIFPKPLNSKHAKLNLIFFSFNFAASPNSIFGSTTLPMFRQKLWGYFLMFLFLHISYILLILGPKYFSKSPSSL